MAKTRTFSMFLMLMLCLGLGAACRASGQIAVTPAGPTTAAGGNGGAGDGAEATPEGKATENMGDVCTELRDGWKELMAERTFPEHLQDGQPYRLEGDFDPNRYFDVLTHLKLRDGLVLDYTYHSDGMGGWPLLYAREEGAAPFRSPEEMPADGEEKANGSEYLREIVPDGSAQSYLEMSLLHLFGNQFYLFWHANYADSQLLCGAEDLDLVEKELDSFDLTLPADVRLRSKLLFYEPRVTLEGEKAIVRLVTFTKWGGFREITLTLDRENPAQVIDRVDKTLIAYECGIMF